MGEGPIQEAYRRGARHGYRDGLAAGQERFHRANVALRILCGMAQGVDWTEGQWDEAVVKDAYRLADAFLGHVDPDPHDQDPNPDPHQSGEPS